MTVFSFVDQLSIFQARSFQLQDAPFIDFIKSTMLFSSFKAAAAATLLAGSALAIPPALESFAQTVIDSGIALSGLNALALVSSFGNMDGTCTPDKLKIRQEWYATWPADPDRRWTGSLTAAAAQENLERQPEAELHLGRQVPPDEAQPLPGRPGPRLPWCV